MPPQAQTSTSFQFSSFGLTIFLNPNSTEVQMPGMKYFMIFAFQFI